MVLTKQVSCAWTVILCGRVKIACVYTGLFSKHTLALWCSKVYSKTLIRQHLIWIMFTRKWIDSHLSATFCQYTLHVNNVYSIHASYRCKYALSSICLVRNNSKCTRLLFHLIHVEMIVCLSDLIRIYISHWY